MNETDDIAKPSLFDDIHSQQSSLWMTKKEFETKFNKPFLDILKQTQVFASVMYRQENSEDAQEYYFALYENYLLQYKKKSQLDLVLGILPLTCYFLSFITNFLVVKVECSEDMDTDEEIPFFFLSSNKNYDILIPDTIQNFKQWNAIFKSRCILTSFAKSYKNIKVIGKGTFAKVLLCVRMEDKQEFAVKTYDKLKIKSSDNAKGQIMAIKNEIEILQQLNHKNIIHLHEVYEGDYHIYLVLDIITGGELFDRLQSKSYYSEQDASSLTYNLLSALSALHSIGIMHRDIKPENLLLRNEETETEIVLADFGLSEGVGKKELQFQRCGTPGYIAPEILRNEKYDTKVDIFSAGIILYIILTGYTPFFGNEYSEILENNIIIGMSLSEDGCFNFLQIIQKAVNLLKAMLEPNPKLRITANEALMHP